MSFDDSSTLGRRLATDGPSLRDDVLARLAGRGTDDALLRNIASSGDTATTIAAILGIARTLEEGRARGDGEAATSPAAAAAAANAPTDVQHALDAVPVAREGDIIASSYHNSVRAALIAIAAHLGEAPPDTETVLTFAPGLQPSGQDAPWLLLEGLAAKPTGAGFASGWLPLQIPDGITIQKMRVIGRKAGNVAAFTVQLLRQPVADTALTPVVAAQLEQATGAFVVPVDVPAEHATVDNNAYKYIVTAEVIGAEPQATVQIGAIQLVCSR
jgi:hypothetical protein